MTKISPSQRILFFWWIAFFAFFPKNIFAQDCPDFSGKPLVDAKTILAKTEECFEARQKWQTTSIEDFRCPAGEFSKEDPNLITHERLVYYVGINLLMNEADKKMKAYMKELEKSREKNGLTWSNELRECLGSTKNGPAKNIRDFYREICNPLYIQNLVNTPNATIIKTRTVFPQKSCENIAAKKELAWQALGEILMTKNINKSYENDRSEFVDRVQGAYRRIIGKFHTYQKIIFRAASKITNYIVNPVK